MFLLPLPGRSKDPGVLTDHQSRQLGASDLIENSVLKNKVESSRDAQCQPRLHKLNSCNTYTDRYKNKSVRNMEVFFQDFPKLDLNS